MSLRYFWSQELLGLAKAGLAICAIYLSLWSATYLWSKWRMYKMAAKFPGPKALPLIGNAGHFMGKTEDIFPKVAELMGTYGQSSAFRIWIGSELYIIVCKPQDIQIVLSKALQKGDVYRFSEPWTGHGIFTAPASKWRRNRKLLTPTFNIRVLEGFVPVFQRQNRVLVDKLTPLAGGSGVEFDAFDYVSPATLDIICETAMGTRLNSQDDHTYTELAQRTLKIESERMYNILYYPDWIFYRTKPGREFLKGIEYFRGLTDDVIKRKRREQDAKRDKSKSKDENNIEHAQQHQLVKNNGHMNKYNKKSLSETTIDAKDADNTPRNSSNSTTEIVRNQNENNLKYRSNINKLDEDSFSKNILNTHSDTKFTDTNSSSKSGNGNILNLQKSNSVENAKKLENFKKSASLIEDIVNHDSNDKLKIYNTNTPPTTQELLRNKDLKDQAEKNVLANLANSNGFQVTAATDEENVENLKNSTATHHCIINNGNLKRPRNMKIELEKSKISNDGDQMIIDNMGFKGNGLKADLVLNGDIVKNGQILLENSSVHIQNGDLNRTSTKANHEFYQISEQNDKPLDATQAGLKMNGKTVTQERINNKDANSAVVQKDISNKEIINKKDMPDAISNNKDIINKDTSNGNVSISGKDINQEDNNYIGSGRRRRKQCAFLDMLMDEVTSQDTTANQQQPGQGQWTNQQLNDEVSTMMIAGNDTTATVVCFTMMMLGIHQDVQEKVVAELRDIFGEDRRRDPEMSDLPRMTYLEMVIKETMRLYPVGPLIARKCTEDIALEHCTIPRGANIGIGIYGVHRDPEHWPEPDRFLPERFAAATGNISSGSGSGRHPYAYMPFSAGPRNCIGIKYAQISLLMMLSTILRHYRITCDHKMDDIRLKNDIILKPIDGYMIRIQHRR